MNSIRAFLCGSGSDFFSTKEGAASLIAFVRQHAPSAPSKLTVAYVGTATYDLPDSLHAQTDQLEKQGCQIVPVCVANPEVTSVTEQMKKLFQQEAHVVLVSGGNTLYAVRRWKETGLDAVLTSAAQRQVVLAGGSAGAICWFTSGHSDSANPKTFLKPSILRHIGKEAEAKKEEADAVSWIYIRVPGLNILPGFLCPHYDREACDGQPPRYTDVGKMLKRHPTERCIALDHWAVLKLHGDGQFSVEGLPGKTRLDPPAEESPQPAEEIANKAPGVFILEMDNGALTRRRVPSSGVVSDLLRPASGPLVQDPFVSYFAMANPTPQSGRFVTPGS